MERRRAKDPRRRIELVAVTEHIDGKGDAATRTQCAAVFVPDGEVGHFLEQLGKYANTTPKKPREVRHEDVYDRVASVRLAALRALWTDADEAYPADDDDTIWWEVWLRRTDGHELERLRQYCDQANARMALQWIEFDDRIVTLVYTSPRTLSASLDVMGDIAELQRAKETATFFLKERPADQAAWTLDLAERTTSAGPDSPTVCLLDTGVNAGHPLISDSLDLVDCHACDPRWGIDDDGGGPGMEGHGTEMAGLALYGDLVEHLVGGDAVYLRHRLESVKILPPAGRNDPDLYGAVTAEATSRPEIQDPTRQRVFAMAVTAKDGRDRGQPTSWSAAVDALAAGRSFDPTDKGLKYLDEHEDAPRRLFVLSAGNIEGPALQRDHISRSDVEPVHDPAQAWNALTVGAFTDKVVLNDPDWSGWSPVAHRGDLSPWSTTSVVFQPAWPIKPEVVFEGGNVVHDGADNIDEPNPGRRGWQTKHRYQSHGLRFEVKGPTESLDEFRKRLNQSALDEEENRPSSGSDNDGWYLGSRARNRGSVHSDILAGFAADIAERGTIAVYPVTGWWKELKKRDRSEHGARYALIVSIETDAVDADIWTPIANQVGVPVAVES